MRSGAAEARDGLKIGDELFSTDAFFELTKRVRDILERHHRDRPLEKGMAKEALRAELELTPEGLADLLSRNPGTAEEDALVRLVDHRVELSPEQAEARAALMSQIEGSFSPPLAKELSASEELIRSLLQTGDLVRIGDFYLSSAQASEAFTKVRERIETAGPQTVAEIRDLLGTTRKYAVPLCEWLDSLGATRRQGDKRALGPRSSLPVKKRLE
jgi:selenocysteine-specific elongation factor